VRIEGTRAKLTIKGLTTGVSRAEFEYAIPVDDAAILLDQLCEQPLIDKHRHVEDHGGLRWEVDVFHGPPEAGRPRNGGDAERWHHEDSVHAWELTARQAMLHRPIVRCSTWRR
jgi:hypothetical protein